MEQDQAQCDVTTMNILPPPVRLPDGSMAQPCPAPGQKNIAQIVPDPNAPPGLPPEISEGTNLSFQGMGFTSFRMMLARERGVEKNVLISIWGGIGDQLCSEPTVRFAVDTFKDVEISVATHYPEFFRHLKLKRVFDLKDVQPLWEKYAVFATGWPPENIANDFICSIYTHCVDWPSLVAFRAQLPMQYKAVQLELKPEDFLKTKDVPKNSVVIHPGKHWESKTFPKEFWDAVISEVKAKGCVPVLIGADADKNRKTVDVDTSGCLDFRNALSLMETAALLDRDGVLLTNDSAPLHLAAPGRGWIGFVATAKRPDYLMHYRDGKVLTDFHFGFRMQNFGKGGYWELGDYCPAHDHLKKDFGRVDKVKPEILAGWLPDPKEFAEWACSKVTLQ